MRSIPFLLTLLLLGSGIAEAITLDSAIALGKQRSLRQEGPRIDRVRVEGQISEAWSNALPQLDGSIGYQRAWKKSVVFFPNPVTGQIMPISLVSDNAATGTATLTQPLYTFGRIGAGLKAAYAAKRANDHMVLNNTQSLELEIMKRFWTVQLLRDVVEVRRNGLAVSDSALLKVQRLKEVGLMSEYDVLRAQVQANNQRPQLLQAENNLRLAEMSFRELLGIPIDSILTVEGTLTESTSLDSLAQTTEALKEKVSMRSDLEALRDLETVYRNGYIIYNNMHWPTIGAQVQYSWQWSNDKWAISPINNASSVTGGIGIQIPLWSSGKYGGKAEQFKADWRKAQLDLAQAERGAQLQFESAIDSYHTAIANELAAQTAVTQAEQARKIAQTKLEQGQITPLEMDSAHLDELAAKVTLAQAKFDRLVASTETRMAAGVDPYNR